MKPTRTARDGFAHLLNLEWTKFWTGRGGVIGMASVMLLTLLPGLLLAVLVKTSCEGPNGNTCPVPPLGPGGQAVEDRFYFVHQALTGDGSLTVRITSMTGIITYPPPNHDEIVSGLVPWAKAGVILKESLEPGAAYAAVLVTGRHGVRMQANFTEDTAGLSGAVSAEAPRWLRLTRAGDALTAYESADGILWTEVGTAQLVGLPATVQVGLFVASPCDLTVAEGACRFTQATATFDQIRLEGEVSGAWRGDDVGDNSEIMTDWERYHRANGLVESGGTFTVTGTGDLAPLGVGWTIERTLIGTGFGLIIVIVVAVQFATVEERRGLNDRQAQTLIAKAMVIGTITFMAGLVAAVVGVQLGRQVLLANGNFVLPVPLLTEVRVTVGSAALLALGAVFALGLGALFRRRGVASAVAIAFVVLPYFLALTNVLPIEASQGLLRLTPAAGFAIQQSVPAYPHVIGLYVPLAGYFPLAPWVGLAVLGGYTTLAVGLAVFVLRHRREG